MQSAATESNGKAGKGVWGAAGAIENQKVGLFFFRLDFFGVLRFYFGAGFVFVSLSLL